MEQSYIILLTLWILYCIIHSLLAESNWKKKIAGKLGRYFIYYRIFYILFALITLAAVLWYQFSIKPLLLFNSGPFLVGTGFLMVALGLAIMVLCIKKYFVTLSGINGLVGKNKSSELIISGIHNYVRHPLYLGTFIFIWGLLLLYPYLSILIMNCVITMYTVIAIRFEEDKLVNEFGEQYKLYQKKVPKLIPKIFV